MATVDAVVVGSGPNGLTAAVTLAAAGLSVEVHELAERAGGGARTEELTLPGFRHDPCSAVHPLGAGSPVLRALPLARHGLRWIEPELALAHPFPDGSAAVLTRLPERTADSLGPDAARYLRLVAPFLGRWAELADDVLRPPLAALPRHPLLLARFGIVGALPVSLLAKGFRGPPAQALLAGLAAHAIAPLTAPATGGVALMFAVAAHSAGWPIPHGGSQTISDALLGYFRELGGEIRFGRRVRSISELPAARAYLLDTSPADAVTIAGDRLSPGYVRRLAAYRYGPAVVKLDYALDGPMPWTSTDCRRAGTVHLGPRFGDIDTALREVTSGRAPPRPFLIVAQPSLFDDSRAPQGKHVLWVYAHVPSGWTGDLTSAVERQLDEFAPGFRDLVLARAVRGPAEFEADNPNYVGGDIGCGSFRGRQTLFWPVLARNPYATTDPAIYLCSAATPPGPGVHGMCGYHAARLALRRRFGRPSCPLGSSLPNS